MKKQKTGRYKDRHQLSHNLYNMMLEQQKNRQL